MTTPLTEQDLIQLNAYLDGELNAEERVQIETRLAADERLQAELESLRVTAALLGMAERVRVPRSFTLDPEVYGRSARSGWWASLGLGGLPVWATAGITVLVVLVCVGLLVFQSSVGGMMGAPSMAEPVAMVPQEAPAEAMEPTEAAEKMGAADAQYDGEPAAEATMPPAPTLSASAVGGGVGGGPSEDMLTAEAGTELEMASSPTSATTDVPPGERNAGESGADTLAAPATLPIDPFLATEEPSVADEGQAALLPPVPDVTQYQTYTAPTPTPWVDGQLLGFPVKSILLLVGIVVLIAGVVLISIALKRHPQ